jgi:hypothetical protein
MSPFEITLIAVYAIVGVGVFVYFMHDMCGKYPYITGPIDGGVALLASLIFGTCWPFFVASFIVLIGPGWLIYKLCSRGRAT